MNTCLAPARKSDPDGPRCGDKARRAPCPTWGWACGRHHADGAEKRAQAARTGGKNRHRAAEAVLEGELVGENTDPPRRYPPRRSPAQEALAPMLDLPHRRQSAILALVQFGTVEAAARHAEVEVSDVEGWMETDETFQRAYALLAPHSPRAQGERMRVEVTSCIEEMGLIVRECSDRALKIAAARIIMKHAAEAQDVAMTGMIDKLIRRIERLEEGKSR